MPKHLALSLRKQLIFFSHGLEIEALARSVFVRPDRIEMFGVNDACCDDRDRICWSGFWGLFC